MPKENAQKTPEAEQEATRSVTEQLQKLVALAQQENQNEARNAAIAAVRLMAKHEIVVMPRAEFEKVTALMEAAKKARARAKSERTKNMVVGALLGHVFLGKGGLRL